MPNDSAVTEQAVKPTKEVDVGASTQSNSDFEAAAVSELFGDQSEKETSEPLINRVAEETDTQVAEASGDTVTKESGDDPSELVSMLKANQEDGADFNWVKADANDSEIASGLEERAAGANASFKAHDVAKDHEFESGDVIVFEQNGEKQVAFALTDFRGKTKYYRQNEAGDKRSYSSIERAFPGLQEGGSLKIFNPAEAGGQPETVVASGSDAHVTEMTITQSEDTRPVVVEGDDTGASANQELLQPVELTQTRLEGQVEKVEVVADPAKPETSFAEAVSERQELLSQGKAPSDQIEVTRDGKTETLTVGQRLRELDAKILESRETPNVSDSQEVFRLEIVDPIKDGVREASDKLRIHDLIVNRSAAELTELQQSGKKPEDLTGRQIMKNGELVPETVADRARELRTIIRDELDRSLETAEKNSPGPLNPEITRRLDVESAKNTAERTQLMQKLGLMDPRLVNPEHLNRMKDSRPEARADIDRLIEVMEEGSRIQDVRHGLAYTKLRSAEMKAMGYANPELGLNEGGNPNDVRSAFTDLTHAREVDAAVRMSQAGYEVEIVVASKVAPLMMSVEQGLKYSDLDNRFQRVEERFREAGMDNETRQNKELAQLQLAQEIDALLVLGNDESTTEDKEAALKELDTLSKNKIDGQSETAQDVLTQLTEAAKAGAENNLSREEVAIRLAAEKASQLDLGFLNAESKRDFFRMRGLDGSIVDPEDPNRRVPTFADRFAMMRDVGARAKLERARTLQDLTNKSDQILESVAEKYRGMSVEQVLNRTRTRNETDHKLLEAVATRYYGTDADALKNVSIEDLMAKQNAEKDEAALLMLEVSNEAPHLIYKLNERGDVTLIDEEVGQANFEARFGVSQADSKAFAEAKRRYERVADGSETKDIDGTTINPHVEIQKMKELTLKMSRDVKRQKPMLQARVRELQLQKEGLGEKSFTSEEARTLEAERLQKQIDDINDIIKVRDESMKTQSSLTKFMEATHEYAQGNHDNVVSLLDEIKAESPDMYKDEAFGMEELHKNSDGWGGWFRRNWKTIAAVGAIAAGVVIGAATLGAGSPLSAALIAGGASTLAATTISAGVFVAGTTAASTLIYSGTGRAATGEWNADHAWEGFNTGLKTSAFMLAGYGVGAALTKGAGTLATAGTEGTKFAWAARGTATALNRLQNFKLMGRTVDMRYAVAGTGIQSVQTGTNLYRNWDKVGFDEQGLNYLKGEALQFGVGSMINTWGLQFMGTGKLPIPGLNRVTDPFRHAFTARPLANPAPFFSRATLGTAAANYGRITLKTEMFNAFEDGVKKGMHELGTNYDIALLGGKNQPNLDWLTDRQGTFRDNHQEIGGVRELLFRRYGPNHSVDWNNLQSRLQYNANLYDSGANRGLDFITNRGLLATGNPLVFQRQVQQPVERKVWIPEMSAVPTKITYGYDGKITSTPIITDQSATERPKLHLRVDGLTGPDPHGLRNRRLP